MFTVCPKCCAYPGRHGGGPARGAGICPVRTLLQRFQCTERALGRAAAAAPARRSRQHRAPASSRSAGTRAQPEPERAAAEPAEPSCRVELREPPEEELEFDPTSTTCRGSVRRTAARRRRRDHRHVRVDRARRRRRLMKRCRRRDRGAPVPIRTASRTGCATLEQELQSLACGSSRRVGRLRAIFIRLPNDVAQYRGNVTGIGRHARR